MHEILLVLNVKATTFLKAVTDFRVGNVLKNLSSALIFGGVAVGVFLLARGATGYLLDQQHIGLFLFHRFLSMLLYVFFVTVNLGNMIVCYATLYKSDEVNFLMSLPIRHESIFTVKFIDNFFYSSSTLFLLGIALLLGYGSHFGMPWYFYFFTLFAVLLPFMLVAGILAVILLMVLLKIASRVGVRWLLAGIMTVYLSAIYLYFTFTNPVYLVQEVMRHYPDVNAYFGYLDPPFARLLPSHWVAEFLYWTMVGENRWAIANLGGLYIVLTVLLSVAAVMARKYYYASWLAATGSRPFRFGRPLPVAPSFLNFGRGKILSWQTDSLLRRDFWAFFREPSQWLHLLLMLLLLVIFLTSMSSLDLKLTQPFLQTVSYLVIFLFDGFLVASVTLRFVFPAVSLEGDAFWCVRSAPISLQKVYWLKFIGAFLPVFLIAEILSVVSTSMLRSGGILVVMGAVCSGFIALSLTAANLGAGAYFAAYREKNPIRVASSQGASLTFLGSMLYLGCVVLVLMVPVNRYLETLIMRGSSAPSWLLGPIAAVGALSILIFFGSTFIGLAAIRRDY